MSQAAASETELIKIIRNLQELTAQAIHRVYKDEENGRFVKCEPGGFAALAEKLSSLQNGLYLLNGSIALYLKDAKGWDEKVRRLMVLMTEAKGETTGCKMLFDAVDAILSEILDSPTGLKDLIGPREHNGASVMALVQLFLGCETDGSHQHTGLGALTKQFKTDALPNARVSIASRIVTEIRSYKRFCPHVLDDELKTLRTIANAAATGIGKYLSQDDLTAAFVLRSQRLITNESLAPYLSGQSPDVKLDRILFVEENIVGAENKRRLAAFVTPVITGPQFEEFFQNSKLPVVQRLAQIESFRARVVRSDFQDNHKTEIADILDRIAASVASRNRLFEMIDKRKASPADKAMALIKLISVNALTSPRLTGQARAIIIGYTGKPGFLRSYATLLAQDGTPPAQDVLVTELMRQLERAGITPKTGLKSIAS